MGINWAACDGTAIRGLCASIGGIIAGAIAIGVFSLGGFLHSSIAPTIDSGEGVIAILIMMLLGCCFGDLAGNYFKSRADRAYYTVPQNRSVNSDTTSEIDAVIHLLEQGSGYASVSFIMRKTGLSVADLNHLTCKTNRFKKSLIITDDGGEVYMLNRLFSGILDLWKTFCHINAMKF